MKLNRIIIHELIKDAGKIEASFKPSTSLLTVNDGLASMIQEVHDSFEKLINSYHKFKPHSERKAVFINAHKYSNGDETDNRFYNWSKTSMRELEGEIKSVPFATGGYYVFSDYELNGLRFLSIVIVRNKEAFNIKWDPAAEMYNVDSTENINIDQMAMGFRLNVNLYKGAASRNYIALINKKGDGASQYFKDWVCVDEGTGPKQNTNNFIDIIKKIGLPENFEGDDDVFFKHVYDTIDAEYKGNNGFVNVDRISELFYRDRARIRKYAEEEYGQELDSEFKVHTDSLKKLIRFKAAVKGLTISLDIGLFQNDTVVLKDNSVIIRNQSIYDQLLKQRNEGN
ncbi:nucleoid-associated protein [Sphingobacterium siyangense]|uniref:nucleoid-associated protein n=1 Tax=Sphingobacterium siyangense TaxID=459529 RepID=UPI003DA4F3C8